MLSEAHRPVIISGGGVLTSGAHSELLKVANMLQIPVTHTLMGTGTFPSNSPLDLGMLGMHGNFWANHAVSHADVILHLEQGLTIELRAALNALQEMHT